MKVIDEIRNWEGKPKELIMLLTESVIKDEKLFSQLIEILKTGSDVEKGTASEVMKFVSKDRPKLMAPYIDVLVEYINYKAPRVKWGCLRSLGNMAKEYPDEVEKAIPKLIGNTKDKSTVVRWCTAFALSEIVKNKLKVRKELVPKIKGIIKNEKNNGVKNVYLKALKTFEK